MNDYCSQRNLDRNIHFKCKDLSKAFQTAILDSMTTLPTCQFQAEILRLNDIMFNLKTGTFMKLDMSSLPVQTLDCHYIEAMQDPVAWTILFNHLVKPCEQRIFLDAYATLYQPPNPDPNLLISIHGAFADKSTLFFPVVKVLQNVSQVLTSLPIAIRTGTHLLYLKDIDLSKANASSLSKIKEARESPTHVIHTSSTDFCYISNMGPSFTIKTGSKSCAGYDNLHKIITSDQGCAQVAIRLLSNDERTPEMLLAEGFELFDRVRSEPVQKSSINRFKRFKAIDTKVVFTLDPSHTESSARRSPKKKETLVLTPDPTESSAPKKTSSPELSKSPVSPPEWTEDALCLHPPGWNRKTTRAKIVS